MICVSFLSFLHRFIPYFVCSFLSDQELALYSSFNEDDSEICVFCGKNDNNLMELGKKYSYGDTTAHHFCLVIIICNPTV